MATRLSKRRCVRQVTPDSTHPPKRTFAGSASQIARTMARKDVSPKGLGSAVRMNQYFINRGGKGLSATRRRELERAKRILQRAAPDREMRLAYPSRRYHRGLAPAARPFRSIRLAPTRAFASRLPFHPRTSPL